MSSKSPQVWRPKPTEGQLRASALDGIAIAAAIGFLVLSAQGEIQRAFYATAALAAVGVLIALAGFLRRE